MWFNKESNEIINELSTNLINGLSSSEAKLRLDKNGLNKLEGKKKKSIFQLFLAQINDVMIYILLIAAIISFMVGEVSDSIIILIVIIIAINLYIILLTKNKIQNIENTINTVDKIFTKRTSLLL